MDSFELIYSLLQSDEDVNKLPNCTFCAKILSLSGLSAKGIYNQLRSFFKYMDWDNRDLSPRILEE